jgi:dihydroorotate dehydrogenase
VLERVIISAPFGNYLTWPGCTPTLGTYTWLFRAGPWGRLWKVLSTVRYYHGIRSWKNRLGLPNPGLPHLYHLVRRGRGPDVKKCVLSVLGFTPDEWWCLVRMARFLNPLALEVNDSCPNVDRSARHGGALYAAECALARGMLVTVKLAPLYWLQRARQFHEVGVRCFHCCNTIPTPGGGLSGKVLKNYSLWAVRDLRQEWGRSVDITGGGGIDSLRDVDDYLGAGVDRVAVGSMLFNPLSLGRLTAFAGHLERHFREARP